MPKHLGTHNSTPSLLVNRIQNSVGKKVTGSLSFKGCALLTTAISYRLKICSTVVSQHTFQSNPP